jgi:sporulation integral membrane protein YtvI
VSRQHISPFDKVTQILTINHYEGIIIFVYGRPKKGGAPMKEDRTDQRRSFLINLLYYAAIILIIYIYFKYVISWLTPFIIGFLIAAIINPAIKQLEKRIRIGRKAVSIIVLILGYAALVSILTLVLIQAITVLKNLFTQLPKLAEEQILPSLTQLDLKLDSVITLPVEWREQVEAIQESLTSSLINAIGSLSSSGLTLITNISKGIPKFLVGMVFTILASFYFSFDYDRAKKFIMRQLPERGQVLIREVKLTLSSTLFRYIRGYSKIMLITFIELSIGLLILRVNNAIPIALGIALFDIFPILGTGGIVIPWSLISLLTGNTFLGIGLLVLYAAITLVRNFIEPQIIGDQLGLNPLVAIISMYLGFVWMGVGGMILMPISVQILLTLQNKGVIRLYKPEPQSSSDNSDTSTDRDIGKTPGTGRVSIKGWSAIIKKLKEHRIFRKKSPKSSDAEKSIDEDSEKFK